MTRSNQAVEQEEDAQPEGMRIEWDVPIEMEDGVVLRADVFRPVSEIAVPVLLTYGPYGKGLRFSDHHREQWEQLTSAFPEVLRGSSGRYQAWETPDPERWVAFGYAVVRVDSRGSGRSPGFLDPSSPREFRDAALCIEWAGAQAWSTGRVGMLGISYYASSAWRVASLEPAPACLAAVCAWEGNSDTYRDTTRHGGILSPWALNWWNARILPVQHGVGERGHRSPNTGELVSGPETLPEAELAANRADPVTDRRVHVLDDEYYRTRSAIYENITVPLLSAANWGGAGLHLRGNIEAFVRAASVDKYLEVHGLEHWTLFYADYGVELQRKFLDKYLKGEDSGWRDQPKVALNVRRPDGSFELREESDWPIPDTIWGRIYLDLANQRLSEQPPSEDSQLEFNATGDGLLLLTTPLDREVELTGPMAAKLFVSSTTIDADLFLVVHVYDPDGKQVTFQGAMDPLSTVAKGWLRASHQKLDATLTRDYRPYHTHDEIRPLTPGEIYELDIEIWPTSIVVPAGYRVGLSVLGHDYFHVEGAAFDNFGGPGVRNGSGGMLHNDPDDRPEDVFGGVTTVHTGPEHESYLLVPVVPPRR